MIGCGNGHRSARQGLHRQRGYVTRTLLLNISITSRLKPTVRSWAFSHSNIEYAFHQRNLHLRRTCSHWVVQSLALESDTTRFTPSFVRAHQRKGVPLEDVICVVVAGFPDGCIVLYVMSTRCRMIPPLSHLPCYCPACRCLSVISLAQAVTMSNVLLEKRITRHGWHVFKCQHRCAARCGRTRPASGRPGAEAGRQ